MHLDTILGLAVIVVAYGFTVYLMVWCRWTINRIARKRSGSLRRIVKELGNGG